MLVVITGASAGVGRATARAFAQRGAKLGLLARAGEGLDRAHEEAGTSIAVPTDVAGVLWRQGCDQGVYGFSSL